MKNILFRYSFFNSFLFCSFILIILISIVWLTQSLRFLEIIIYQNIGIIQYMRLIAFLIPDLITLLLPTSALVTSLYTLYRLKNKRELYILQAIGLSNARISAPLIFLGVILTIISYSLTLQISSSSFKLFKKQERLLKNNLSSSILREDRFNFIKDVVIYVRKMEENYWENIFIFKKKDNSSYPGVKERQNNTVTIFAKEGMLRSSQEGYVIILKKGYRQDREIGTDKLKTFSFDSFTYSLSDIIPQEKKRPIKPYEKSFYQLWRELSTLQDSSKLRSEFHQRLIMPTLISLNILIGCMAFFSWGLDNKSTRKAIFLGCVIGIFFQISIFIALNIVDSYKNFVYFLYTYLFISFLFLIAFLFKENFLYRLGK